MQTSYNLNTLKHNYLTNFLMNDEFKTLYSCL